ncbi:hypothetical protein [Streptomyces sp. NPDC004783]|uniref:hypothetical protein n=1 Tax=Streptomyces sp. NPDC004783 TaxID=3154459 RepID=UPI0033BAE0DF
MTARYGEQVLGSALLVPVVRWGNDRTLPGETVLERDEEPLHRLPAADRELFGYVMARPDKPGWELFERYVLPGGPTMRRPPPNWRPTSYCHPGRSTGPPRTSGTICWSPPGRTPWWAGATSWPSSTRSVPPPTPSSVAITGPAAAPRTPLLVGTTAAERCGTSAGPSRSRTATAALADVLTLAAGEHP